MASLSITHQISSLSGTPIQSESGTSSGDTTAIMSAAAVWKTQPLNLRCRIKKQGVEIDAITPPVSPLKSPCRSPSQSPVFGAMRPDLSVACQALVTESMDSAPSVAMEEEIREYWEGGAAQVGRGVKGKGSSSLCDDTVG